MAAEVVATVAVAMAAAVAMEVVAAAEVVTVAAAMAMAVATVATPRRPLEMAIWPNRGRGATFYMVFVAREKRRTDPEAAVKGRKVKRGCWAGCVALCSEPAGSSCLVREHVAIVMRHKKLTGELIMTAVLWLHVC